MENISKIDDLWRHSVTIAVEPGKKAASAAEDETRTQLALKKAMSD